MTVELILRYLAKARLIPQGLPGKRSVDWFAPEIKNLILALAAYQPSDAVNAVLALNNLPCDTNDLLNLSSGGESRLMSGVKKGTLFGDWIVEQIEKRSHWIEDEYNPISEERAARLFQEHCVSMTVEPPGVWAVTPYSSDSIKTHFYYDVFQKPENRDYRLRKYPVLFRETRFTVELLIAAGRLLADTLAKQPGPSTPDPVPGRTGEGDDATPDTMKAAGSGNHDGPLDTPASRTKTRTRRRRSLNKAQLTAQQEGKQLLLAVPASRERGHVRDAGPPTCNP